MASILGTYALLLLFCSPGLAHLANAWIRESQHKRLSQSLQDAWISFSESNPSVIVKTPLKLLSGFWDAILGARLFGSKSFLRFSLMSSVVLVISLEASGLATNGRHLTLDSWPWDRFRREIRSLPRLAESLRKDEHDATDPQLKAAIADLADQMMYASTRYDSHGWAIAYTAALVALIFFATSAFSHIVCALTRHLMREILRAPSFTLLSAGLLLLLSLAGVVVAVDLLCVSLFLIPGLWPLLPVFGTVPLQYLLPASIVWSLGVWTWGGTALRVIALVAAAPALLAVAGILFCLIVYPVRSWLHRIFGAGLLRLAESEKPILFTGGVLLAISSIVAATQKLLS